MKSMYMILDVAAALGEARVGVNKSDSTQTVYMTADVDDSGVGWFCMRRFG